ncbi:unnamed protein product, partial [Urochloa humidicola]
RYSSLYINRSPNPRLPPAQHASGRRRCLSELLLPHVGGHAPSSSSTAAPSPPHAGGRRAAAAIDAPGCRLDKRRKLQGPSRAGGDAPSSSSPVLLNTKSCDILFLG